MNSRNKVCIHSLSRCFAWNPARYFLVFFLVLVGNSITQAAPRFSDVPLTYWAFSYVETIAAKGITNGCTPTEYCPDDDVDRAQMAVFLLRAKHGQDYVPPSATGTVFADVPATHWAAAWIEQLAAEGITNGCGGGNYCPGALLSRDQMAVFLLRTRHGQGYVPPTATGTVFDDVPATHWAAAWIEQLAAEGITNGCDASNYCPQALLTRAQMAVVIARAYGSDWMGILNDTGITWGGDYPDGNNSACTSNINAPQDCHQGRDAILNDDSDGHAGFSFTKLDADGSPLPADATSWSCVRDNVTGLVWESKTNDGGLHNRVDGYTWYNTDSTTNGGNPGDNGRINSCYGYDNSDPATYCNTQAYVARVNQAGWCGFNDWRVPTKKELLSLVDYSVSYPGPTIDSGYFPYQVSTVWSSTPYVANSDYAWAIYFGSGDSAMTAKDEFPGVRLVRGGE